MQNRENCWHKRKSYVVIIHVKGEPTDKFVKFKSFPTLPVHKIIYLAPIGSHIWSLFLLIHNKYGLKIKPGQVFEVGSNRAQNHSSSLLGPISHPVVKRWLLKPAFKHSLTSVYLSISISHPVVKHWVNHSLASAGYVHVDWQRHM